MPIVALLALFAKGPLGLLGYYIWFFDLPLFPNMMHALYGCLFFIWLFVRLSNQTMDTLKTSSFWHCFSTFILYYVVYIATETFVVAWIGMTFFHNAQYLFYNWRKRDFIIFQQKSSNPLFFYFILLIISASIYGAAGGLAVLFSTPFLPTGLISVFAINILHYVCDSFIWRRQHL
jgi:hypothetical protein